MRLFKQFFLPLFSIFYFLFSIAPSGAQTMSNSNFKLKTNILLTPDKNLSNNKANVNNTKDNIFLGANYRLISGFQYDSSSGTKPLIFSISQTLIDYGILSPTNPVSRTNVLSIYNNFINGYSVTAFENHSLYNEASGSTIPDTTCDTGTCSEQNSSPWSNILTYGFGYRCENASNITTCSNDFYDTNHYKQFTNISNPKNPQIVMDGTALGENKARITYKLNISGTQPIEFYSNAITFIATPNF